MGRAAKQSRPATKQESRRGVDAVPGEHGRQGRGVAGGQPALLGVLGDDVDAAVAVLGEQVDDVVVGEAIVHGQPDGPVGRDGEGVDDVDVGAVGGEELAGGDVPVAEAPGALLPAGEGVEGGGVFAVDEGVVVDRGGDEAGVGFAALAFHGAMKVALYQAWPTPPGLVVV